MPNRENIYICIDDNSYNIPNYQNEIKIIKIDDSLCIKYGFRSSVLGYSNRALSRDKALFYFCKINIDFDNIWFIEEDVLIPTIETIENIDNKYQTADLLSAENIVYYERQYDWHWRYIYQQINMPPPYARSMICAIRCSKKLLECINGYVSVFNNLFVDEALFNTVAIKNNLKVLCISELSSILYRHDWKKEDIHINNLYHPVKCMEQQRDFREGLFTTSLRPSYATFICVHASESIAI
jgi:hypothetical protein